MPMVARRRSFTQRSASNQCPPNPCATCSALRHMITLAPTPAAVSDEQGQQRPMA